jgi:1-deoxy-D-xylulose-5-phosphate synthase
MDEQQSATDHAPTPLLDRVHRPQDLHAMTSGELEALAEDVRTELVRVVFETGGHLASNLGTVELTIALHSVFDSPHDKLVWDVGHQAYVHKLLTGRRERFPTIRQAGGLCPFPEREESVHDVWGAGHASTSLSAALGMAIARDISGDDYNVVAIIGDGGLTGGMALEAMNHIGAIGKRLIVVFNDNGMSIAPNVGAINSMFNKVRLDWRYQQAKHTVHEVAKRMPLGEIGWEASRRAKRAVKGMLMPSTFFEQLGFEYVGPVDGHDIGEMRAALQQAERLGRPVFIHAITQKGHGYAPAEADPVKLHGVSPAGGGSGGPPKYQDVFGQAMLELMAADPMITAITAAMPDGTGLVPVLKQFPERAFDVGICEQHAVTLAAGMATQGLKPVCAIYSTFLQRAYDQIIHDVCVQDLHVVFALDRAGFVGDDGRTHQGAFDLSYLSCIPNMVVCAPKDERELRDLLYTGLQHDGPFAVRYPRGAGTGAPLVPGEFAAIPIGSWEIEREGDDVAILAVGAAVQPALLAADELAERGVSACVVNARFVKPLDVELLHDLAGRMRARHIVTVEENVVSGGFGSDVALELDRAGLNEVRLDCIGMPDKFVEHATQKIQRARYGVTSDAIVARILRGRAAPEPVAAT